MGILDPKTRFIDSIVTNEGRRQIAQGKFKAEYYSFSDSGAFYSYMDTYASGSSTLGSEPSGIATRFCFESTNLAQDQVTFEADDSGRLSVREFRSVDGNSIKVINGEIFSGSTNGNSTLVPVTASTFASLATGLLTSSSINNFQNLYIIGSPNLNNQDQDEFLLAPNKLTFKITDERPIPLQSSGGTQEASIDHIESLYADKRLSHVPNFQFLPPVNKPRLGRVDTFPIGVYPMIGQRPILNFSELQTEIDYMKSIGFTQEVRFSETSEKNRIFGQFFELSGNSVTKLDVIDFGIFAVNGSELTEEQKRNAEIYGSQLFTRHVFFVGKVFVDSTGSDTFVNMFTLIFH